MPAMLSLVNLPPELLDRILDFVDGKELGSFRNLALTCRLLNHLATPRLYHTVDFREKITRLGSFACSILASRERASMVRSLWISTAIEHATGTWTTDDEAYDALKSRVHAFAPDNPTVGLWEATLPEHEAAISDFDTIEKSGPRAYALFFLVAFCTPRLKRLHFDGIFEAESVFKGITSQMLASPAGTSSPSVLPRLEHVFIRNQPQKYPNDTEPLALFALLPWIQSINCCALGDEDGIDGPGAFAELKPRSSELKSLSLQPHCKLHRRRFDLLLQAPKALESFKYNAGHTWAHIDFNTTWLRDSLKHQRQTLEYISLTHNFYEFGRDIHDEDFVFPMSFAEFPVLKTLEISLPFVFGSAVLGFTLGEPWLKDEAAEPTPFDLASTSNLLVDMLPPSIETLRFAQCGDAWAARRLNLALLELLDNLGKFGSLSAVEVHGYEDRAELALPELRPAFLQAKARGIAATAYKGGYLSVDDVWDDWKAALDGDPEFDDYTVAGDSEIVDILQKSEAV